MSWDMLKHITSCVFGEPFTAMERGRTLPGKNVALALKLKLQRRGRLAKVSATTMPAAHSVRPVRWIVKRPSHGGKGLRSNVDITNDAKYQRCPSLCSIIASH